MILVTTKSGSAKDGKATVRYSGRFGWEEATTSTDYENRGYWSVYEVNRFWQVENGGAKYINYTDRDMQQLLARVNDKTEHPDRPWVVEDVRNGRKQWVYYGNYDWWDMLFREKRPVQQHSISLSGGTKDIKYLVSGAYDRQAGMQRAFPDIYNKYNLRSKIDFRINRWATLSNNTSFFSSDYNSQGDSGIDNTLRYGSVHALACYPMQNPDGSWVYSVPYQTYKVANGRHIMLNEGSHRNVDRRSDFSNTTRLVITPVKTLSITGDFTYRLYQERNTSRSQPLYYRVYPDAELAAYDTGAGLNKLTEEVKTRNYYSTNVFANYDETFGGAHHLAATAGMNYETWASKNISVRADELSSTDLDDLNLATKIAPENAYGGGQNEYALLGFFGRINYDYKGRYLMEVSGRYDGTSRFDKDNRWGCFPSASVGWRISEEPFFGRAKRLVDNLKLRASFGSLGNQNVSSYYTYMRLVSIKDFGSYNFGDGTVGKYSSLGAPIASDLTWETAQQWDLGLDVAMLGNRLNLTADIYMRDTKDMLTAGVALPGVYGADSPDMNAADLRTKGYELTVSWRDQFRLAGKPFEYSVGFNISDYKSVITKYDNPDKSFAKDYYVGKEIGEIWGFRTDGFFKTDEEAKAYAKQVDLSYSSSRLTAAGAPATSSSSIWTATASGASAATPSTSRATAAFWATRVRRSPTASTPASAGWASTPRSSSRARPQRPDDELLGLLFGLLPDLHAQGFPRQGLERGQPRRLLPAAARLLRHRRLPEQDQRPLPAEHPLPASEEPHRGLHHPREPHQEGRHRPGARLLHGREPLLLVAAQEKQQIRRPRSRHQPLEPRRVQPRLLSVAHGLHVRHRHHLLTPNSEYHETIHPISPCADRSAVVLRRARQDAAGSRFAVRLFQDRDRSGIVHQPLLQQPAR